MGGLPWRPQIAWDVYLLRLTLPCRPWTPRSVGVGGRETSAAGVPAAYEVRRDRLRRVTLRCFEWEWEQVERWLEWAQATAASFAFRFDQDDASTEYTVYLDSPAMGEAIEPQRSAEFEEAMEITVELRHV